MVPPKKAGTGGGHRAGVEIYAEELDDNLRNWRLHPYAQEMSLRDAKQEVGWAGALLYNERTKRLIDGHLRKRIARKKRSRSWSADRREEGEQRFSPLSIRLE